MLAHWLAQWSGLSLFDDRLFRAGGSALFAAAFVFLLMPPFIDALRRWDATSDFGSKEGSPPATPIFGGALVITAIVCATLCFSLMNAYAVAILCILVAYALIGGLDDYMKIRTKKLIASGKVEKKEWQEKADGISASLRLGLYFIFSLVVAVFAYKFIPGLDGHITVPLIKPETWYPYLPNWAFILLMSFVTTSTANGANFTDGLDTLVSVPIITTAGFVGLVAYISGNAIFSDYLLLPHLPGVDELMPIAAAIVGAMLAYLWYNCPPAEIYLGDAGSIGIGGAIGMMFVLIKAELFIPIVGIVFLGEAVSVVLQIGGFKLTRKFSSDHVGRRLFRRAPIHDHFRLLWAEKQGLSPAAATSKVIWRFHLVSILGFVLGSLIFFKLR